MIDKIERPSALENQSFDIYDARLIFRKTREGSKTVTVKIRYSKKGWRRKEKLPFPEDIDEDDLDWTSYRGQYISVYHRIENMNYKNIEHIIIPTSLGQKLEKLVREVYLRNIE